MNKIQIPDDLINLLINSERVVVLTGAGVSAESGIKTFRDPDGLWAKFNPAELASMNGFMKNPELVWDWYQHRREIINKSEPNPGHLAIAQMHQLFSKFALITQNVDRLHHRAGSDNVIELHGNIIENYCVDCHTYYDEQIGENDLSLPKCKKCYGKIRPAVVWFGEMLPEAALIKADELSRNSQVFFSVGTSSEVYPAANLPLLAKENGAVVIEVNPNETAISRYMDYRFRMPSGEILPVIIERIKERKGLI